MANRGVVNTNGSQFFITRGPAAHLNGRFSIFGQVSDGQQVVDEMQQGETIQSIEILDPTEPLFTAEAKQIEAWNTALAARANPTPGK